MFDNGTSFVIEENQVDTLRIFNLDVRGNQTKAGELKASQFSGFDMAQNLFLRGAPQLDGFMYGDMEVIEMWLSPGSDELTVENTSPAVHVVDMSDSDDTVYIKDIQGPFIVRGENGDDTVIVSSDESKLNHIKALLAFDGGVGNDELILDNSQGDDDVLNVTRAHVEMESLKFHHEGLFDSLLEAPRYSYWLDFRGAVEGDFILEVTDSVTGIKARKNVPYPLTAERLRDYIFYSIIPEGEESSCGELSTSPCAPVAKVVAVGEAFAIFFVGERKLTGAEVNITSTANLTNYTPEMFQNITQTIIQRNSDISYYNVEHLNVQMGGQSTVLNVRGTTAKTNISTQEYNDFVFISSEANQNIDDAESVDVLSGWLDYMEGDLTVDVKGGRHRLLISDEKSSIPKGTTDSKALLSESSLSNLAGNLGDIAFNAEGGNWNAGVNIWLGKGNDVLEVQTIPSVDSATGNMTATIIHAGDGDDKLTVSLSSTEHDGSLFIANGQGGNDVINASASSFPVILFGDNGDDTLMGGSGSDIIIGDYARITWASGKASNNTEVFATTGRGGYNDFTDGIIRNVTTIISVATDEGGNDKINLGDGTNVGIGGAESDTITSGTGDDIVAGDSVEINFTPGKITPSDITSLAVDVGGKDFLTPGHGNNTAIGGADDDNITCGDDNDLVAGDSVQMVFSPEDDLIQNIKSLNEGTGGFDTIDLGNGNNVGIGGAKSDTITSGTGNDIVAGDSVEIEFFASSANPKIVNSLTPSIGGNDVISLGDGDWNYGIGGPKNDTIESGNGMDILAGDSVLIEFWDFSEFPHRIVSSDCDGGFDSLTAGGGSVDYIIGGAYDDTIYGGDGPDLVFGDHAEIIMHEFITHKLMYAKTIMVDCTGGDDYLDMGEGDDIAFGGAYNDYINGSKGQDILFGGMYLYFSRMFFPSPFWTLMFCCDVIFFHRFWSIQFHA